MEKAGDFPLEDNMITWSEQGDAMGPSDPHLLTPGWLPSKVSLHDQQNMVEVRAEGMAQVA